MEQVTQQLLFSIEVTGCLVENGTIPSILRTKLKQIKPTVKQSERTGIVWNQHLQ